MKATDTRTTLNLPHELAERIDSCWHARRLNSRNEAIRLLLAYAVDAWERGTLIDAKPAKGSEKRR